MVFKEINTLYQKYEIPDYAIGPIIAKCSHFEEGAESKFGFYHFSNVGVCSWYDFAVVISEQAGQSECFIHPSYSSEYQSRIKKTFVLSPRYRKD